MELSLSESPAVRPHGGAIGYHFSQKNNVLLLQTARSLPAAYVP